MRKRFVLFSFFLLLVLFIAQSAGAAMIYETDRAAFEAAHTGLTLEDFEAGTFPLGHSATTGPLHNSTDNSFFSA